MSHPQIRRLPFGLIAVAALAACTEHSPTTPDAAPDAPSQALTLAAGVHGAYVLTFFQVSPELILQAHVEQLATSQPAQGGTAVFQICLDRGGPTLQMVPLPSAECAGGGSGTWVRLGSVGIDPATGNARIDFGIAPQFTTVGFRFRYNAQGSGILNGVSLPLDFVP
jgi:hypothetical protein